MCRQWLQRCTLGGDELGVARVLAAHDLIDKASVRPQLGKL